MTVAELIAKLQKVENKEQIIRVTVDNKLENIYSENLPTYQPNTTLVNDHVRDNYVFINFI